MIIPYVLLFFAIIAEIIATSALKLSLGFTRLIPSMTVIVGYGIAFWLMSLVLKSLPVGIVYAIWCGVGIIGMALIGAVVFHESFGLMQLAGTVLILAGVIVLTLTTNSM